jgi:hypothetical protein
MTVRFYSMDVGNLEWKYCYRPVETIIHLKITITVLFWSWPSLVWYIT